VLHKPKSNQMKKLLLITVIAVFLSFSLIGVQAQSIQEKLNQVELMKQWTGNWKAEIGTDTTFQFDCKQFYNGYEFYLKTETKDRTILEWKTLAGYDKSKDKFIEAAIIQNNPDIVLMELWFTSPQICEEVFYNDISNPENASGKATFEFKSTDLLIWTESVNNKVINRYTFYREKQ
jgi:hypothetical protein